MRIVSLFFLFSCLCCCVCVASPLTVNEKATEYPIDAMLGGVESRYSGFVRRLAASGPSSEDKTGTSHYIDDAFMECYKVSGDDFFIAVKQSLIIRSSIEQAENILDDFSGYHKIFEDLIRVDILEKDKNKTLTLWEQHIPTPFAANDITELYYITKKMDKTKVYRYQLKKSTTTKTNDGFIAVENNGEKETIYTEYDFIDGDWGVLRLRGAEKIWKLILLGILQSDFAVKLKAENPEWKDDKILKESRRLAERWPVDECIKNKKALDVYR